MHPDDQPHEWSHFAVVVGTCGHVTEVRGAQPLEPVHLVPMSKDKCVWCQAKDYSTDLAPEVTSPYKGGVLLRQCPLSLDDLKDLATIEKLVIQDGPNPTGKS